MKNRIIAVVCITILACIMLAAPVSAGDLPESALLHADGCFLGTVQKVEKDKVTIKISEVVFGSYSLETAEILDFKYWTAPGSKTAPKKGEYCAVVVKKEQESFRVYEGLAAKADSLDKKSLKLKSSIEFLKRMNNYINNGWYSNENINRINQRLKEGRENNKSTEEENKSDKKTSSITPEVNTTDHSKNEIAADKPADKSSEASAVMGISGKQLNYVWLGIGAALLLCAGYIGVRMSARVRGRK